MIDEKYKHLVLNKKNHPDLLEAFNYDEEGNIIGFAGAKVYKWRECEKHGWYPTRYGDILSKDEFFGEPMVASIMCDCPHCLREKIMAESFEFAAIPKRFRSRSIETFEAVEPWQQKVKQQATDFVANLEDNLEQGRCIVMCGNPGTGKTHLAIGIASHAMKRGRSAVYTTVQKLVSTVRDSYGTGKTGEAIKKFVNVDVLIIDEVGVQAGTDNERQILFEVINDRYGEMKTTIIMSNLAKEKIIGYLGERAWDRLIENSGLLFVFSGKSYRRNVTPVVSVEEYKMKKMILPEEIEYLRQLEIEDPNRPF